MAWHFDILHFDDIVGSKFDPRSDATRDGNLLWPVLTYVWLNCARWEGRSMWYYAALINHLKARSSTDVLFEKDGDELTAAGFLTATQSLAALFKETTADQDAVVLLSDKSRLLLPAIVAAGALGKTYAPVAPDTPEARLNVIKDALDVERVFDLGALEESYLKDKADHNKDYSKQVHNLEMLLGEAPEFEPDKPVYVLFTSGSTGLPKGVMIGEKSIEFFTHWAFETFQFSGDDVLIAQVPETFDLSVLDIYACLALGCKLVSISKEIGSDTAQIVKRIKEHSANSIFSTPSFFNLLALDRQFEVSDLPSLNRFLLCGEVFQKPLAKKLKRKFPATDIYNLYGPTEATVAVTSVEVTDEIISADGALPIGRPMGDMECLFLDEDGSPNRTREGEMAFTGDTVGIGYLKMPDRTAQSFVTLTGKAGKPVPAYRTGDTGYLADDGFIYYRGRNDGQIKWSGHRIEIGEIEHQLNNVPFIQTAAVLPVRLNNGDVAALIAYVVASDNRKDEAALNAALAENLPHYMLPSAYKFVNDMPMTSHGKIDRKELERKHAKLRRS